VGCGARGVTVTGGDDRVILIPRFMLSRLFLVLSQRRQSGKEGRQETQTLRALPTLRSLLLRNLPRTRTTRPPPPPPTLPNLNATRPPIEPTGSQILNNMHIDCSQNLLARLTVALTLAYLLPVAKGINGDSQCSAVWKSSRLTPNDVV